MPSGLSGRILAGADFSIVPEALRASEAICHTRACSSLQGSGVFLGLLILLLLPILTFLQTGGPESAFAGVAVSGALHAVAHPAAVCGRFYRAHH